MHFQLKENNKNGFIFNMDKCVGCHACILACMIENKTILPDNWRTVYNSSNFNYSEVPLLHISIACNHCEKAPCMKACPSNSYSRDKNTGAITINTKKCIGCSYCSWVCPFDAPKFNIENRTMEKCNFCSHRIEKGKKPACVLNCPVGALQFGNIDPEIDQIIPGFSKTKIRPLISIIPPEIKLKKTEMDQSLLNPEEEKTSLPRKIKEKIILKNEWQLALLTSFIAILTSVYVSFNPIFFNSIEKWLFALTGVLITLISFLHLGKPYRSWRAIGNLKTSWLSREVFFFSLFMLVSVASFFQESYYLPLRLIAILFGLLSVISVDLLYRKLALEKKIIFNGSEILIISAFLCIIMGPSPNYIKILLISAKFIIVVFNHLKKKRTVTNWYYLVTRFVVGLVLPTLMIKVNPWLFTVPIMLAEIADRFYFYKELKIDTPEKQMLKNHNFETNEK